MSQSQSLMLLLKQNNAHSDSESDYGDIDIKDERSSPEIVVASPIKQTTPTDKKVPPMSIGKLRQVSVTPPSTSKLLRLTPPTSAGKKMSMTTIHPNPLNIESPPPFSGNTTNIMHRFINSSPLMSKQSGAGVSAGTDNRMSSSILQHIKQEENYTVLHHDAVTNIDIVVAGGTDLQSNQQPTQINLAHYGGTVKAATLSDLEGIDMMHLPVDLDDAGHIDILNEIDVVDDDDDIEDEPTQYVSQSSQHLQTPTKQELMQETDACYLSLIRDIFCSTPNHRTTIEHLKSKISAWLSNPITALNDWYCLSDNWLGLLQSAIHFLSGDFADQPEDFVPYIEYKQTLQIYQWIGAGRDSDQHLMPLCDYWLLRRSEMGMTTSVSTGKQRYSDGTSGGKNKHNNSSGSLSVDLDDSSGSMERPASPPPPRFPTVWVVHRASDEEIEEFRAQERHRFDKPHKSFTYRMHGFESVVGPVKGIYTEIPALTKARGHNMLTQDRPNFVTILTLVRDATARLPNGEGMYVLI